MAAANRWKQIKTVTRFVQKVEEDEEEESEEEEHVYEIEPEPEPMYKYKTFRKRESFMRPIKFEDKEAESTTDILPDKNLLINYIIKKPKG